MWTFIYKFDTEGYLTKYKSRIVARGDLQRNGLQDTYAATLFAKTFRAMMGIAAFFGLEAYQWDIQNAFVNAVMDEDVFVEFPDGYKQPNKVILLQKALYGLRRSPRLWQKAFVATLTSLGLKQALEDSCVFSDEFIVLLVFVDDIIAFCRPENREYLFNFRDKLNQKYPINNHIQLQWIPTSQMPADGLTKPLPQQKHTQFVKMLGLTDIKSKIHTPEDSHDGQEQLGQSE
jgi:Reverse transcriptase (RNA-dependent DNA polymerase)